MTDNKGSKCDRVSSPRWLEH